MPSFEWNKIAGGVLGTALFILVVSLISESLFDVEDPEQPAYIVEGVEGGAPPLSVAADAPVLPDFATAIPAADIDNGRVIAARCAACHDWTDGGPHMAGPNLYNVVGSARANKPGFTYSAAMRESGGQWSYGDLYRYLRQPALFLPGNIMAFAGLPAEQDLVDLIAFMRGWADNPHPLPPAAADHDAN